MEFLRGGADWGEVGREHELGSEGERGVEERCLHASMRQGGHGSSPSRRR